MSTLINKTNLHQGGDFIKTNGEYGFDDLQLYLDGPIIDSRWPVCSGIPFPKGKLWPISLAALKDCNGREISCQTQATVLWPDGSVRWLLLDIIADMNNAQKHYVIELPEKTKHKAEDTIIIDEKLQETIINTGVMTVVLSHYSNKIIEKINVKNKTYLEDSLLSIIRETGGIIHNQSEPITLKVEKKGDIHSVIFIEGTYGEESPLYHYQYRLHFYAGLPLIRIDHTIINKCPGKDDCRLSSVDLQFYADKGNTLQLGDKTGKSLKQLSANAFKIDDEEFEGRYNGSFEINDVLSGVIDSFWQRYPASIRLEDSLLSLGLLTDNSTEGMIFAQGEAQSHEIWLWIGQDNLAPKMAEIVNRRPILISPPEWTCSTKALGDLSPYDPVNNACFENALKQDYQEVMNNKEINEEYGYRDFGDSRYDQMPRGWLNNEYDWGHAYFLAFARTGDRRYFDLSVDHVRHMMNTDIIHFKMPPDDFMNGAPHTHDTDHTTGDVDIGHSWLEGLFDYWAFLGDPSALEHGRGMADFYTRCIGRVKKPRCRNRPGARRPGWALVGLVYAYEYTLDKKYLDASEEIVRICDREQIDTGTWLYPGGCLEDPTLTIGKTFMVALTLIGLKHYHQVTGDKTAKDSLIKGVDWAIDAMWDEKTGGFRYIDSPYCNLTSYPGQGVGHMLEPLEYAYRITGNLRYKYVASQSWKKWIEAEDSKVKFSDLRDVVHYLPYHISSVKYSGTFPQYSVKSPATPIIRDIKFIDENIGWAACLFGLLLHTQNGGETWATIDIGRSEHLYSIDFIDDRLGWAAGFGNEVIYTRDGGKNWDKYNNTGIPANEYLHVIKMINKEVGYVGGRQRIWKTGNGGKDWYKIWDVTEDGRWNKITTVTSMYAVSKDKIWAVGSSGLVMTVEKNGSEFNKQLIEGGFDVDFIDSKLGFIVTAQGIIFSTTDGGRNWNSKKLTDKVLWQVGFYDKDTGYITGDDGVILVTNDGGISWTETYIGINAQLRALNVVSKNVAVAGGDCGVIMRTSDCGQKWEAITLK